MDRAAAILDQIESNEPCPIEYRSDLDGDREMIPDLWLDTIATRRLKVAVDYLAGVRDLVTGGVHYDAPFPLLRAVLESAVAAIWLLESDERSTRLKRLVGLHIDDTNNKKSVQFMVPEEYAGPPVLSTICLVVDRPRRCLRRQARLRLAVLARPRSASVTQ